MGKSIVLNKHNDKINVYEDGGMVTGEFEIDGDIINPFYSHPWSEDEVESGILKFLKGDFVCVPFGITPVKQLEGYEKQEPIENEYAHGYSSNGRWEIEDHCQTEANLKIKYNDNKIESISRNVRFLEGKSGIKFENKVRVHEDLETSIGIHPIFRLNEKPGSMKLNLPKGKFIATYPTKPEDISTFKANQFIDDITKVPLSDGGTIDVSRLPLDYNTEELIMVCGIEEGKVVLENLEEKYKVILEFDCNCFESCMLWISNKGRGYEPWNNRNLCLGIEPVTAAFDLGENISASSNLLNQKGIKTAVLMKKEESFNIEYKIYIEKI